MYLLQIPSNIDKCVQGLGWGLSCSLTQFPGLHLGVDGAQHLIPHHPRSMVVMAREGHFHPVLQSLRPWVHWLQSFINFQNHHYFHPRLDFLKSVYSSQCLLHYPTSLDVQCVSTTHLFLNTLINLLDSIVSIIFFRLFPFGRISTHLPLVVSRLGLVVQLGTYQG